MRKTDYLRPCSWIIIIINPSFVIDINECSSNNGGCSDQCTNTDGGFYCSCSAPNFQLSPDGRTCTGKNQFSYTKQSCVECKYLSINSKSFQMLKRLLHSHLLTYQLEIFIEL